jgi:hypothetical protein
VQAFTKKPESPVDFAQPALAIDVLGVLGSIALSRGFGYCARDGRALDAPQMIELGAKAPCAFRRRILRAERGRGPWRGISDDPNCPAVE